MKRILLTLSILLIFAGVVAAQEELDLCEPVPSKEAVIAAANALDTTSDEAWQQSLVQFRMILATFDDSCLNLSFNSERDGMSPVIGPVAIPSGRYRVTFTTDGFGSVQVSPVEGTCSADGFTESVFAVFEGEASNGTQTSFESEGCLALIEISNTGQPWTLEFEALILN